MPHVGILRGDDVQPQGHWCVEEVITMDVGEAGLRWAHVRTDGQNQIWDLINKQRVDNICVRLDLLIEVFFFLNGTLVFC